jgi:hypothetical protein
LGEFRTDRSRHAGSPVAGSDTQTVTLEGARNTYHKLLYRTRHAVKGSRNANSHALAWFAARAHLGGVFESESFNGVIWYRGSSELQVKKQIMDAVKVPYKGDRRNIRKMLADSWRYGVKKGRLSLVLYPEDFTLLQMLQDDARFQNAWDGNTSDFANAVAAKEYMESCLAQLGCIDVTRILQASDIFGAVVDQILVELKVADILAEGGK